MKYVGLILILIGTWFFFNPDKAVKNIYRHLYRQQSLSPQRPRIIGARVISLLWVAVGVLIFLKG